MGKGIRLITLLLAVVLVLPAACLAEKQERKYVDLESLGEGGVSYGTEN